MTHRVYPLALIFFALCADQASASPRLDTLARCALEDSRDFKTETALSPTLVQPAKPLALSPTLAPLVSTPDIRATLTMATALRRAFATLRDVILLPTKYGCAVFGAGPDKVPEPPKKKHKPRMLTLF
jgi:hypothetical protein